jgi:hypothetical protein
MPEGNVNAPLHEMDPSQYDKQPNLVPRQQRLFDDLPDHDSAERERRGVSWCPCVESEESEDGGAVRGDD